LVVDNDDDEPLRFQSGRGALAEVEIWEYEAITRRTSHEIAAETTRTLAAPDDFPPIEAAIVSGDKVALAIDPNVPSIDQVVEGVLSSLRATQAASIELVVWDEITPTRLERLREVAGDHPVHRHQSSDRSCLCYLAADPDAEPIYLNRTLVEADFVLPIVAVRPTDYSRRRDLTGVFPTLGDSATRRRYGSTGAQGAVDPGEAVAREIPWLLGVHVILTVTPNSAGQAGEIRAGTIEAIAKRITPTLRRPDPVPPPAELVVASLDGDRQQQTWENVVRAAEAAQDYAEPDATIVVWSSLDEPPQGALLALDAPAEEPQLAAAEARLAQGEPQNGQSRTEDEAGDWPTWDRFGELARRLRQVTDRHRVMLHSRLAAETVEPLGLGVVGSPRELANLSRNFASCGVVRAASFAGGQ
jgi:hypothetical protein